MKSILKTFSANYDISETLAQIDVETLIFHVSGLTGACTDIVDILVILIERYVIRHHARYKHYAV